MVRREAVNYVRRYADSQIVIVYPAAAAGQARKPHFGAVKTVLLQKGSYEAKSSERKAGTIINNQFIPRG